MKKRTFRKLEVLLHFLTALLLLLKGIHEISLGLYYPGGIITGLAVFVLAINLFWRRLHISPKQARIICYYLESPALAVTAYMIYLEGKEQAYIFLVAALLYPAMGHLSGKKKGRKALH